MEGVQVHPLWSRIAVLAAATAWFKFGVENVVPEPYMDEIFHVPQAQAYCRNDFKTWDPKLTTPAGLYLLSYPLSLISSCSPAALRAVNALGICAVLPTVCYYLLLELHSGIDRKLAAQTAVNVAFFPLLFFFAGLYYTDVYSTIFVLSGYLALRKRWIWSSAALCWVSLWFRQTNVLWTVFMMGVHAVETLEVVQGPEVVENGGIGMGELGEEEEEREGPWTINMKSVALGEGKKREDEGWGKVERVLGKIRVWNPVWAEGVGWKDFIQTPLTIAVVALHHLPTLLLTLAPYILVLLSFVIFIITNSFSIVLGDKSAHQPTLHIPQLFYFLAFTTALSFPLILTPKRIWRFLLTVSPILLSTEIAPTLDSKPRPKKKGRKARSRAGSASGPPGDMRRRRDVKGSGTGMGVIVEFRWEKLLWIVATIASMMLVVRFNTVLHPYLIADNRHFVFYIFRRGIRAAWWGRYIAVGIYWVSGWLIFDSLRASGHSPLHHAGLRKEGVTVAWLLLWGFAVVAGLVNAGLVEFRYFILGWVLWRLSLPVYTATSVLSRPSSSSSSSSTPSSPRFTRPGSGYRKKKGWKWEGMEIWAELGWFAAVNGVAIWLFLRRPFVWGHEEGVQRFMW
ncbi:glucosyltransferase [Rhizina undulata]